RPMPWAGPRRSPAASRARRASGKVTGKRLISTTASNNSPATHRPVSVRKECADFGFRHSMAELAPVSSRFAGDMAIVVDRDKG
ncbi:MAG: hypothetical protein QM688_13810, partial [Sphingomonas bacterium]